MGSSAIQDNVTYKLGIIRKAFQVRNVVRDVVRKCITLDRIKVVSYLGCPTDCANFVLFHKK